MSNAIQQLLEKFLALTNEEQTIFFNAMVASRSGERINDMGVAFNEDLRFRDGILGIARKPFHDFNDLT